VRAAEGRGPEVERGSDTASGGYHLVMKWILVLIVIAVLVWLVLGFVRKRSTRV
jgi:hypothetical protein